MTNRRAYLTVKKRESRDRARAAGRCIICTTNPADIDLVTCSDCRRSVTETRRTYAAWSGNVRKRARANAGDDLDLQHHQPVDRMVEFIVRMRGDVLRRKKTLPWYDWRDTDPSIVAEDIVAVYRELHAEFPTRFAAIH